MKEIVKNIQKLLKYFLIFWFAMTIIPGMESNTNQMIDIIISSIGFSFILFSVPIIMTFFKLSKKNYLIKFLTAFVPISLFGYILKSGITGIIYYPKSLFVGKEEIFATNLNEFGIILLISFTGVLLFLILDHKEK